MIEPYDLGDGVIARAWERSDAAACLAAVDAARERLARWMPWVPFSTTVEDFESFIERAREHGREGTGEHFGLFDGDAVVGAVGASIGSLNYDEADVGYWLAPTHEGRGLASAGTRYLIDWLFDERDMHRITIRAALDNTRSRAVAERLGFTYEGVLRRSLLLQGEHRDAALYSVLRDEWGESGG